MKCFKRIFSVLLVCTFIFSVLQINTQIVQATENNKVYMKIRYYRPDNNYDNWNIWTWEEGKEGKQVNFIGQDEQGQFAVVETSKEAKKLNFLIRKGNWEEKATNDESVDLNKGDTELIFNDQNGSCSRESKPLNRSFDKIVLKLHYYRFDKSYDSWDAWSWVNSNDSKGYLFSEEDDFGKIAEITKTNTLNSKAISFLIREGGDAWKSKDIGVDRSVDFAYANNKGEINAYIVQGDEKIYSSASEPIRDPKIASFKIDSENIFSFNTNTKINKLDGLILKGNDTIIDKSCYEVKLNKDSFGGTIKVNDKIDLNKKYILKIPKFESKEATFGKVYNTKYFEENFKYDGELGAIYSDKETKFAFWSPTASNVKVALYGKNGKNYTSEATTIIDMTKDINGLWTLDYKGNLDGVYYNYLVTNDGKESEVTDPYSRAVGVNGKRSMVVDLNSTNPIDWDKDKKPVLKNPTDATIYEMHIRDFSMNSSSGITNENKGKYLGVCEKNTTIPESKVKTGISHLKELGINTVQLMPSFDYISVDESKLDSEQFNWGYDPQNYSVPEGSYSSNPYDGKTRIKEFKEMVNELHKQGIKVVMDVVYNHTGATDDSLLNLAVPDYYYRKNAEGKFSSGSGCGNETASERFMVRKLIVDSVKNWAKEYHIDGFRFDLMGIHDIDTMKTIRTELDKIDSKILMYGEGWAGGTCAIPSEIQALKNNAPKLGEIQLGMFSDDIRDGLRGDVFHNDAQGFLNGKEGLEDWIKFGIVASTKHDGIDYEKVAYSKKPWANEPYQTINYASCHDNLTLWDRLKTDDPKKTDKELVAMNKLSASVIYTSQGIPFIQAGEEFARTKVNEDGTLNHNSFNSSDSVNSLDYDRINEYPGLYDYYRGLINLRKNHNAFRMNSTKEIQKNLNFLEKGKNFDENNVIAYTINAKAVNDTWNKIAVIFNANDESVEVTLPNENWTVVVNEKEAGIEELSRVKGNKVIVPEKTAYVLVDTESYDKNLK